MRRRRRPTQKKEKFIMLASSLFVLSALTLTGFYVKERNNNKLEKENSVDFSMLEDTAPDKSDEIADNVDDSNTDLDVAEANTAKAINPQYPDNTVSEKDRYQFSGVPIISDDVPDFEVDDEEALAEVDTKDEEIEKSKETAAPTRALSFSEEEGLTWPIVGNVLINYSMDKTVYFSTLQQYKYSPALVIAATEGENIASAADGKVLEIYTDPQLGNCVKVDLGDGFELIYGQLKDITVKKGDYIDVGKIIGTVSAPTKYYSVEGCNVYFKLTKNGEPINPLNKLS